MTDWVTAYLGLGGNLGDPKSAFQAAIAALGAHPAIRIVAVSSLYSTPPWGKLDQPDFLNAVVALKTSLSPLDLLAECQKLELDLKRERKERWGPRPIDLDILWFGDQAIELPGLKVPHPRMTERAFVLIPLAELAPELDLRGVTVSEWANRVSSEGVSVADASTDWWRTG